MDQEKKIKSFAWTLMSVQATLQDVERRILNAALEGGITPEVLEDCKFKLGSAARDLDKFPEKL